MNKMRKEEIRERLEQLADERLISVWNEYQFEISGEDVIYSVYSDFDEICQDMSPTEIADNVCAGDFSTVDDYFQITPYGFKSFPIWDTEEHVYIDELADWIAEDERREGLI